MPTFARDLNWYEEEIDRLKAALTAARDQALREAKQIVRRAINDITPRELSEYRKGLDAAFVQASNALGMHFNEVFATPSTPQTKDTDAN